MNSENVAVDEPLEDEDYGDRRPARPIGAQLAVLGEKAVDFPADLLISLGREAGSVYLGALLLISRWRLWQTDAAQRHRLEDASQVAKAAGGKLPLAHEELSIKRQGQRARLTVAVVTALAIGLTSASIVSLTWGFWQWLGVAGAVALLWAAHEYKLRALAAFAPLPVAVVLLLGVDEWRWWPAAVLVALVSLLCEQVGLRWRPPPATKPAKARPGVSYKVLWETVRLRLREEKVTAERVGTRPLVVEGREVGVAFRFTARERIRRDAIHAVARELEAGVGRVRWAPDRDNEAAGELLIRWSDPLAKFMPCPHDQPRSRSVLEPLEIAVDEDGEWVSVPFAHQNILVTGMTRSGKSALTAVIVDKLSACVDVEVDYIDTVASPDLAAASRCFRRMAVNRKGDDKGEVVTDALDILTEAAKLARSRSQDITEELLGARPGDDPRQNHRPTVDEPQRFVIVEEVPTFMDHAGAKALPLIEEIERRGLKAAVGLILLTQSATKNNGIGSTVIQAQSTTRIGLAMPGAEVQYALGEGRKDAGYRPDLLSPATLDDPRDAGKFYMISPNHSEPALYRSFGLRAPEQIRRSWERHPEVEPASELEEPLDAVVVPEPLATLDWLAADGDVHSEALLEQLPDGWTARSVGEALRPLGLRSQNVTSGGRQAKGFKAEQVKRAVQQLDAT